MRVRLISLACAVLLAAATLSAQDQNAAPSQSTTDSAPKAKPKHVYTDADFRPLDEKCADPSVPAEEKLSCPKPPAADKEKAAAPKPKKEVPIYDEYGSKLPVEPDVTTLGTDDLKDRIRGMQVQIDRSQESIDTWTKRLAAAQTDEEKKNYQKLVDTSKEQLKTYTQRKKEAEAQLATIKPQ